MTLPPDVNLPRRRAWPVLLLLILAIALGLQVHADWRGATAGPTAAPTGGPAAIAASAATGTAVASASAGATALAGASAPLSASGAEPQWGQPGEAAARVARAASAALATARAAAGLTPTPPAERVVELCGVGRLTMPPPDGADSTLPTGTAWDTLPQPLADMAVAQVWPRVLATLSAPGGPEQDRAAALVLQAARVGETLANTPAAALAATRSLARLARNSADPTVLHWAHALCRRDDAASPDCRRLAPRDLVRKAPADGLAWLLLAGQPGLAPMAVEQALEKAAQATRFGGHAAQLPVAVDRAWPEDLPGYLQQRLLQQAQGVAADLSRPAFSAALELCTAQTLASAGRRSHCEALARQMFSEGSDIEALAVAAVLGARLGLPEAELDLLRQDAKALAQAATPSASGAQPHACGAVESTLKQVRSAAAEGEVQAWRRRLAMAPMTARPAASRP